MMHGPAHAPSPARLAWTFLLATGVWLALRDNAMAAGLFPFSIPFQCFMGQPVGNLIAPGPFCPATLSIDTIFSFLICHVESISSQLFGSMFCGIIVKLIPGVQAVLTLAVLFFGMGFTIGVIPATGREALSFLLKLALVWAFATQSEYIIGYGFNFFVAGLRDGTAVVLNALFGSPLAGSGVGEVYGQMDAILKRILGFVSDSAGVAWGTNENPCKNAVFAAIAIMGIAFPPLFLITLILFFRIVMVFLRACFGYMFSIVGIAFLLTLAPIFLSMSLFKQTRPWFDKYLGYLVSFTLQIVIVFAFIAFVLSMDVRSLTDSFADLVVPVKETPTTNAWRWPWEYCTICKFDIVDSTGAVKDLATSQIDLKNDRARCKVPNSTNPEDSFTVLQTMSPDTDKADIITLMKFTGTAILALLILAYIVDRLLDYAPAIAWRLASGLTSGVYAPKIGGGAAGGTPVVTFGPIEYMETAGGGFMRGFSAQTEGGGDSISRSIAGGQEAVKSVIFGAGNDEGLVNGFMRFFINPQRGSSDM